MSIANDLQRVLADVQRLEREALETSRLAHDNGELLDENFRLQRRISELEAELAQTKVRAA